MTILPSLYFAFDNDNEQKLFLLSPTTWEDQCKPSFFQTLNEPRVEDKEWESEQEPQQESESDLKSEQKP